MLLPVCDLHSVARYQLNIIVYKLFLGSIIPSRSTVTFPRISERGQGGEGVVPGAVEFLWAGDD